mgnify:CR=1 FL=1
MNFYKYATLILFLLGLVSYSSAQCGPTQVDPTPGATGVCEGESDTIDFAGQGTCSGNYEYQVETSTNTIVQPWSVNNQFIVTPTTTDTYTVYARCSACPATVVSDTFLVEVIETPTIVADSFVCYGAPANFNATGSSSTSLSWWDTPDLTGNELSPTGNYTIPSASADDTIYLNVEGTVASGNNTTGSILITEAGLEGFAGGGGSEDYLEISNLYSNNVNTTGWVAAISDSYSNINSVNNTIWNLPNSFAPCSIISKTDDNNSGNYWGSNIFWNPNQPGWAIIIDDAGNVADFVAWGWTTAELASFNVTINGYNITLGGEWVGNSCASNCSAVGGTPYSISRIGNADNNNAGDFVCQQTSLNVVNPSLSCGWVTSNITCPYPVDYQVDLPPTATAPDTTNIECYANVPVPDSLIITDEDDDYTANPSVIFQGETSDGNTCPETLTHTYRVSDTCSNYIDLEHLIVINDTVAPVMDPAPSDTTVSCYADIPPMDSLSWSDNCLGSGYAQGTETSSGTTCPEILTRTWTVTDTCGNSVVRTQTVTIDDTTAPVIDPAPSDVFVQCYGNVTPMTSLDWTDNCAGSGVLDGTEVSDGLSCPETFTRTWTYTDGCDNTSTETQVVIVNDTTAPTADPLPDIQVNVLSEPDTNVITNAADNCGTPVLKWEGDDSDGGYCPEIVERTYSLTDDCGNVTFLKRTITVGDVIPDASFEADPTILNSFTGPTVDFENNTENAASYAWKFGDESPVNTEVNPSHEFDISISTKYDVWLVATSEYGCPDSTMKTIIVFKENLYYVPNAFTPDGDEFNQTFKPVITAGVDKSDYKLLIFNRWGETLFESNNPDIGWDGTYGGKLVKEGTYVYKIEFGLKDNDERKVITGHVTLLK